MATVAAAATANRAAGPRPSAPMTRVASGVALAVVSFAVIWFSNATVLLFFALAVGVLAFHEYAALMRRLGAFIPRIPSLIATLGTIVIVPFPYVAGEALIGAGIVLVAIAVMLAGPDDRRAAVFGVLAGAFAALYLGVALGALVGSHV